MHDSSTRFDPPKCHPNTRVAVLEYLIGWIFGRNDPEALILWLYGPAGAGKSAILQTIAELCAKRNSILASFFFSHSDPARNTFKPLIPTIACQIAIAIPEIRPVVELVIERDPFIFDKSIATQLQSLVIHPLKDLVASGFFANLETSPRLVIIDGLDECDDPKMQSMILRTLADALRSQKLPLIFLIASRPEQNIQLTFNSKSLAGLWKSLVLDSTYKPSDDIRTFLVDSFQEIKSTHPLHTYIPNDWPSESNIDHLITKSSGQFIYASVVIKYISAPNDRPLHRLDVIMGLCPARLPEVPFAELDALYMHLLESCSDIALVMRILGVVLAGVPSVSQIEALLSLKPGDVELALAPLSSITKEIFAIILPTIADSRAALSIRKKECPTSIALYIPNPLISFTVSDIYVYNAQSDTNMESN
ncbi:hypothetical protein BDN70DRAFT_997515 [Pholiota conissans]|uniref:NACHT domain-containing protein n=1 Tax=Pholiota conissans TaxID=109636 RepID=A0A9P5YPV6_9AGAR|nr:hypothetical protein BDN70DRAFT_997515 [Pholiota conissans]